MPTQNGKEGRVWKGAVAGLVGGLVATWAMTQFQEIWSTAADGNGNSERGSSQKSEDPTVKTAEMISESVTGEGLSKREKEKAGPLVHYAFGTLMGGVYGLSAELAPAAQSAAGLPFGTALFLAADEVALPILKLTKLPTAYPASKHLYGMVSHWVWAGTTDIVRRAVLRIL